MNVKESQTTLRTGTALDIALSLVICDGSLCLLSSVS